MTHTDTDIAEIQQRFDEQFPTEEIYGVYYLDEYVTLKDIQDFIARECLALKKKWEREHFDNQ